MLAQAMRLQQGGDRLTEARHVLRDIDQRDREVTGGMQHGEAQRTDQHDVARTRLAALPQHDRPGEHRHGQHDGERRVQEAQSLEIEQALAAGLHLEADGLVEAAVLAADGAEGSDQRHVADHVGQFAFDPGRPAGEAVMQRRAGSRQPKQKQHDDGGNCRESHRKLDADGGEKGDGAYRCGAGRKNVPDEEIFDRKGCVRGRGDAAGQSSRQPLREIARCMTGQMEKKFAAQISRHADKGMACDPAGQTPQQIVGGNQ